MLDCINTVMTMMGGLIWFLFKKGGLLDTTCYLPVCLQDCMHKLLSRSAILTDRLYPVCQFAERHGMLYPLQERFHRRHSTQHQVVSALGFSCTQAAAA